jgi:spore germination protein YaaH
MMAIGSLALAGCATARPAFVTPTASDRFFVAGYHPYWAGNAWTTYRFDAIDELYFFEIEVAADGGFLDRHGWPTRWRAMIADALGAGTQVTPTVSMHDPVAFEALFQDRPAVERLVGAIAGLVAETPGLAGIHLDFEVFQPVDLAARDGYTAFVAEVRETLRALDPRLSLSVFTLAFDDDDVYNERALARIADYLVVQGYDYHSLESPTAGPVAALTGWGRLNWEGVVQRFEDLGVPRRRIVMAVPLYGYQWPVSSEDPGAPATGPAVAIPLTAPPDVLPELPRAIAQAEAHGARRDPASGSPYYVFREGAGWQQGWFEDAESLAAKYDFVRRRGLGGVALFPLAYADEATWASLREAFARPRS